MKAFKITIGLIIAFITIAAIVVTVFLGKINTIVKEVIEIGGRETLQTTVAVESVDIQLSEGKGAIKGISVGNPPGYSEADMLYIGSVGLGLDTAALSGEVLVVKEVFMSGVTFLAEHKNLKDTNIQAIIENLSSGKSQPSADSSSSSSTSGDDIRLMIESLQVGATEITLKSEKYGSKNFTIPAYQQSNIGDKQRGLSPEELTQAIISNLLQRIKKAVSDRLKLDAKNQAKDKIKEKFGNKIKEKVDTDKLKSLFR